MYQKVNSIAIVTYDSNGCMSGETRIEDPKDVTNLISLAGDMLKRREIETTKIQIAQYEDSLCILRDRLKALEE